MDSYTWDNNNRYVLVYLECLVALWLANEVIVSFLPVRHKHEDSDQAFSAHIRARDAITLEDLFSELRENFDEKKEMCKLN